MDKKTENLIDKKIDELALAMHKGFENVDKRFQDIDKRFEGVEGEITSIKQDLGTVKEDLREMKQDMEKKSQERHNELMNSNDKMIRIFEASQQELASQRFISGRQQENLENHEKRIKILEFHKAV